MAPHAQIDVEDAAVSVSKSVAVDKGASKTTTVMNNPPCCSLRVKGSQIVNPQNEPVVLKGVGVGGAWNMENFITGYSGHEHEHREALAAVLGKKKADFFFNKLLEYFFTEADAEFLASLGVNCVRIPFNYRHFIDDQSPSELKQTGFDMLDRIIRICGKYNLYVILDLHSAPGGQNQDWHSDSGLSKALFWEHRVFQDQAIDLWVAIAQHYAGNPVIAGYNPLNEPADPQHKRLVAWYLRVEQAIRKVDPDHILFIDGNTYAMDFSHFPEEPLPNTVYACHDYAMLGFPVPGQVPYCGSEEQNSKLRSQFDRKAEYMRQKNVPIWNGEFGPVYANPQADKDAEETNKSRIGVLKEQLKIYAESNVSWSIWLYKDIGYQAMTYVDPESPYMKLISSFVAKKQQLGLDFWGCTDKEGVAHIYEPFVEGLKAMIPEQFQKAKYPSIWKFDRQVERVVRECLMSEYLGLEFAELFRGKSESELDELAASFKLENCIKREALNEVLQQDANESKNL